MSNLFVLHRLKKASAIAAVIAYLFTGMHHSALASSWNPTLLVNTESFHEIDDGDGSSDIYFQFGSSADKRIVYSDLENLFAFTDDIKVYGDISASGSLTVNADLSGDAELVFGNSIGNQLISYNEAEQRFNLSSGALIDGNLTVSELTSGATLSVAGGDVTIGVDGTTIFNQWGDTSNFRVESNNEQNMLFVHGTSDRVGVGTSTPDATLDVQGTMSGENLHVSNRVTSSLVPDADLAYDLGLPDRRWNSLSASGITISGTVSGANLVVNEFVDSDLIPGEDLTYNIGSPDNRWETIYADNIVLSGADETVPTFLNVGNRGGVVASFKNGNTTDLGGGITIETGAVLQIDTGSGNSVLRTTSKNDQPIGIAVNASSTHELVQVLFLGKIGVRCTGVIAAGDLIQTSNTAGAAAKGANSTKVIGTALEPCSGGFTEVLVHLE